MWISLIIALLTYFMSPRDTAKERNRALLAAAGAGALTYGVTEYTEWGQENLKPLDGKISGIFTGGSTSDQTSATTQGDASIKTGQTSGGGIWDTIKGFGPTIAGAVGGAAIASSLPSWVLWGALGLGAYLLVKD